MNSIYWLLILPVLSMLFILIESQDDSDILNFLYQKRQGDKVFMEEALRALIGEECIIDTLKGSYTGKVSEVSHTAIKIEESNSSRFVNLEYIVSARKVQTNKNGKRKLFYV